MNCGPAATTDCGATRLGSGPHQDLDFSSFQPRLQSANCLMSLSITSTTVAHEQVRKLKETDAWPHHTLKRPLPQGLPLILVDDEGRGRQGSRATQDLSLMEPIRLRIKAADQDPHLTREDDPEL